MSMVKFAQLCDKCGKRSPEYEGWPTCIECQEDVCPDCVVPFTFRSIDGVETCICVECAENE